MCGVCREPVSAVGSRYMFYETQIKKQAARDVNEAFWSFPECREENNLQSSRVKKLHMVHR